MAALKYSRQRESIKEFLASTTDHPTADTVYLHVRKEFPHISLGTVYRNLNLLADIGEAVKITTSNGGDRFDARTTPHYHVLCTKCGSLSDLFIDTLEEINETAGKNFKGEILSHTALFYGICEDCLKKEKLKNDSSDESAF